MSKDNPSPQALALREYLQSPEFEEYAKDYARKQKEAEEKSLAFFFSPEFQVMYNNLYAATEGGFIQTDDHPLVECCETVTDNEVMDMLAAFEVVKREHGNKFTTPVEVLPLCDFSDSAFVYKELIFQTICGQGCFTRIMRTTDTEFSYPHYREAEDLDIMDIMN